ncbi:hypothetical protein [Saccharolobus islandicus]|uniref:Uncharacterized protein n=1 Tax=Saccharolobus islandicus (strain M.16.27) TaxID=427318 RepID=C3N611_SACI3|nr:hypothetical protein [Sulfolobus islandicus]ACP55436.1 conserved hypothetical protein [Sulfolobus islandicus M.16.27]
MSFPDHYTIQRMSVIIVGIILVLGIAAMLANYHPAQTGPIATQLPPPPTNTTNTVTPPHQTLNITNYTAYYNFQSALEGLNATDVYKFNSSTLFNFGYGYNPLSLAITDLLSLPANQITPWTYGELYNILDSNFTKWTSTKTVSMYYYPMSLNGSTIYLDFTYQTNPQFVNAYQQLNRSYPFPPSDNVTVNSPVYSIINTYTVTLTLSYTYSTQLYLARSSTSQNGNQTIVTKYYGMTVSGTVYLLANGSVIASNNFEISYTTVPPYKLNYQNSSIYQQSFTISGNIIVPQGVKKAVSLAYTITAYQYKKEHTSGNTTYICYYPTNPSFNYQTQYYNWYEYNVTVPINIEVFNGTNPQTIINNKIYGNRTFTTYFWYMTWSSDPLSNTTSIITFDRIEFLGHNITRTWYAGSITVNPTCYSQQIGNTINYYLDFSVQSNINEPPSYIFTPVPQLNKTVVLQWNYFFSNYSVAEGLFNSVHKNIDEFDFILPQFIASLYKENLTEHTITLASFIEPWNVSKATLNISNSFYNTTLIFLPVQIIPNTSYSIIYSALGSDYITPNVTILDYTYDNMTGQGYFIPLTENAFYNGTIPPTIYSPFSNKITLNYGIFWPYSLPYSEFYIQQLEKNYDYWYNPGWPGWFPIA